MDEKARQRRFAKRVKRKAKKKQREALLKKESVCSNAGTEATTCSSTMVTSNTPDLKNKYLPKSDEFELEFESNAEKNEKEARASSATVVANP